MTFPEHRLGDLVTFQRGFDITKDQQVDGTVPIVSSSGIASFHNESKVDAPGVVIGRKGSLGTVHYLTEDFWPHDTTLWVKDFKGNHPRFISYFLRTLHLEAFDTGSSNPTLNRNHIHKIKVQCPLQPVQRKIAAILSAYDDLIANNQQRIALLEDTAEEIYREWFVRMRFPGADATAAVDATPASWTLESLEDLGTFLNGYAFDPSEWFEFGLPIIKIKELNSGVSADTPRNPGERLQERYRFSDGDVIFSWSGSLVVKIWDQGDAWLNQHLFKVTPKASVSRSFLYLSIKFSIPIFESLTTGATMQHIKRKELRFVKVRVPGSSLMQSFDQQVAPILNAALVLKQTNRRLSETRDALLPRLISGKLKVDHLDIRLPLSMRAEAEAAA